MSQPLFTPADDNFHTPPTDDRWFTETCWFSFNVPERKMGGWFYAWARPNMGLTGGGFFVWDDTATEPWAIPYYKYQHTQPLPAGADLRDFTWPESFSVKVLEPLTRYRLTFRDRDIVAIECEFDALFPPHGFKSGEPPFATQPHLDQMGHITGEMTLHGERIAIDSYSIRDRSWGPRLDHRGGRIGYPFACAEDIAFCAFTIPNRNRSDENEPVNHGFLWQDGEKRQIVSGIRNVTRDPIKNWPTQMTVKAVDEAGRNLVAVGTVESRMMHLSPRGVSCFSSIRWDVNGKPAYGEDQDVWRTDQWEAALKGRPPIDARKK
jgi:hypothetical protein